MNAITRTKNNFEYAYYRKRRDKALFMMEKHQSDKDDREWKKWANICLKSLKKCSEIPLH